MLAHLQRFRPYVVTNNTTLEPLLDELALESTIVPLDSLRYTFRGSARESTRKAAALTHDWARLARAFSAARPALVHLNDISPAGQLGLPPAKVARRQTIVHVRMEVPMRPLHRFVMRYADATVTVSENVLRVHLEKLGKSRAAARAIALPNGVDLSATTIVTAEERNRARSTLGLHDAAPTVVMVSSYEPRKRQLHVLEQVVPRVLAAIPKARFVFAGGDKGDDADYAARCQAAAESLGPRSAVLLGYRDDVRTLYAAADVVLLASLVEGLPRTTLEALALGRPVVATASPGAKELLQDLPAGRLVSPADDGFSMAEELVAFLRLPPTEREARGATGRDRVEACYDVRAVAARFEELCERVLAT